MPPPTTVRRVVVLDDEVNMGKILTKVLRMEGFEVRAFHEPAAACAALLAEPPDVLLTDLRMPGRTGEEMLQFVRDHALPTAVILMTAYGTVDSAMRCVRAGAFDYVTKPFETAKLVETIRAAAGARSPAHPSPPPGNTPPSREIAGDSAAIAAVREMIRKVAVADSPVLVTGESGTGKELAARAIHAASPRAAAPFVAVNCASIPATLMESELFGHEKGAFTGAHESRAGLMEAAGGGTLFLDEIGDMPIGLQSKLLRALQEGEITRLGSVHPTRIDIRVIAATNQRLSHAVEAGTFREDLYYRLNVLSVRMPSLRQRPGDITVLAVRFLEEMRQKLGKPGLHFAPAVLARMLAMEWPGNVRELRNAVERLAVLSDGEEIAERHLVEIATAESSGVILPPDATPPLGDPDSGAITDFREARDQFEANYLRQVLRAAGGNVTEAARRSGMSRRHFYEKLEKFAIDPGGFKGDA